MTDLTAQIKGALAGATGGPWQVAGTRHSGDLRIGPDTRLLMVGPDDDPVTATFFDMKTGRGHMDARLIALAPQMAEAHLAMVERLEKAEALAEAWAEASPTQSKHCGPFDWIIPEATMKKLDAALAAYRGEVG